jgi:hypothetical protein
MLDSPLHEHHLLRYVVNIEDKPMRSYARTANISFFDENNKKVCVIKYGVIDVEEIYAKIDAGEDLNLSNAYVYNFSLTDYKVNKGLDDSVQITLKNLHAKKAFFDCDVTNDFSYAHFEGDKTIFESAIFANGNNNFSSVDFGEGDVNFKKVKFGSGSTSFQSAKFGIGVVTFNNANFGTGNLTFIDCNFGSGNVDFKNTYMGDGTVDFKFARFQDGDVSFEKASFGKGKKDFKNIEFGGGKIDFRRVEFNDGDVIFDGAEFGDGKVSFRSSVFGHGHKSFEQADFAKGEAQFELVEFGSGSVSFKKTMVHDISFKGCALNCYLDLRLGECHSVDLSNTIVRDIIDMMPEDEHVVIKILNISGMRILGRIFIDWRSNKVFDLIHSQDETSLFQKAEQFRILKENFRNNGKYDDEDAAYLQFKRMEAKAILTSKTEGGTFMKKLGPRITYYFQRYVFDFVGRYGTNSTRVLFNMIIVYTIFSLIYYVSSEFTPDFGEIETGLGNPELHSLHTAFYYSAITFFTIGYGDYFPGGALKIVAVLEGFCGVFLMSYFTVAFARKIIR